MKTFSQIVNQNIFECDNMVNEANILAWFTSFLKKTSNFIDIWQKKGGTKYKIDLSKGSIQANNKDIKTSLSNLQKQLKNNKTYRKCYPKTLRYAGADAQALRPEIIDKKDWENVTVKMYVYTPEVNYNGENYPCAIAIIPQKKTEVVEGYINFQSFETSELIMNKEIRNQIFEIFVNDIKKKNPSAKGISIIPKNPSNYSIYKYQGKAFESVEIENEIEEKEEKEKEDEKVVDKTVDTISLLQLTF